MRFGIITINHGRPAILHLWCASIKRLRKETGIDFPVVCVSESEDEQRCAEYGITHITADNSLGSEKWNLGVARLRELDIDFMVVTGSDDIFSTQTLVDLMTAMEQGYDMIGFHKVYIYCVEGRWQGQVRLVTTRTVLGVGKTLSKRVLEKVNWQPWTYATPRRWGMDAILSRNTNQYCQSRLIIDGVIVDCKTSQSLNKFSMFVHNRRSVNADRNIFMNILGEEERMILRTFAGSNLNDYFSAIRR